jgi:hypothetical protein
MYAHMHYLLPLPARAGVPSGLGAATAAAAFAAAATAAAAAALLRQRLH